MSALHCIDTPISWLRLEQLTLGELAGESAAPIVAHLEKCRACSECLETIERDHRVLNPLDLASNPPVVSFDRLRRRLRAWVAVGGVAIAAAAAILFMLTRDQAADNTWPARRVAIKGGGELVLTLVRQRGDVQTRDPDTFANGDRFKVAITCAEPEPIALDVVVIQGREVARPLGETVSLRCGNNVFVPGAFSADGSEAVTVCVAPGANRVTPLEPRSLEGAACATLKSHGSIK